MKSYCATTALYSNLENTVKLCDFQSKHTKAVVDVTKILHLIANQSARPTNHCPNNMTNSWSIIDEKYRSFLEKDGITEDVFNGLTAWKSRNAISIISIEDKSAIARGVATVSDDEVDRRQKHNRGGSSKKSKNKKSSRHRRGGDCSSDDQSSYDSESHNDDEVDRRQKCDHNRLNFKLEP